MEWGTGGSSCPCHSSDRKPVPKIGSASLPVWNHDGRETLSFLRTARKEKRTVIHLWRIKQTTTAIALYIFFCYEKKGTRQRITDMWQ